MWQNFFTKCAMDLDQKLDKFLESMLELRKSQAETSKQIKENGKQIQELRKSQAQTDEQMKRTDEQMKRTDEQMKRTDERMKRTDEQMKRTDERMKRTDEQMKRTDEQMKRTDEQMKRTDEQMKRTDEQMKRTDEQMAKLQAEASEQIKKTGKEVERVSTLLGNMGINTGSFAEEFFYRSLQANPRLGNIFFDSIERRYRPVKGGTDYDIVLKNGTSIGLIEVKYNAHPEHVREIKEKKIKQFRGQVHEFPHFQLYFGLASMITSEKLIENAKKEGIFLLTQKGEHLEVVNQEVRSF